MMMLFSTGTGLERVGLSWAAGFWIVWVEVGLLQSWSAGSGRGTPLQK